MKDDRHLPKYIKIKNIIEDLIDKNNLKIGDRIPTEKEMSQNYNVSRHTVRKAFDLLEREGKLEKQQGVGTFYAGKQGINSGNVGFISISLHDYIFADILHGIDNVLHEDGYQIMLGNSRDNEDREAQILKKFLNKNIEGLIIEPAKSASYTNLPLLERFAEKDIPIVLLDSRLDGNNFNSITVDDLKGGELATEYLLHKSHKKVAIIYKAIHQPALVRLQGYKRALKRAGISPAAELIKPYYTSEFENPSGFNDEIGFIINDLLQERKPPSAIFCFNDQIAVLVNELLTARGLSVPDDISLVGFDNSSLVDLSNIAITSVAHPRSRAGEKAARILIKQIVDGCKAVRHEVFVPELIERSSVKHYKPGFRSNM
ncbi:MAG: GntR family transcriptional regulator [Halanaerobiales bacterium]